MGSKGQSGALVRVSRSQKRSAALGSLSSAHQACSSSLSPSQILCGGGDGGPAGGEAADGGGRSGGGAPAGAGAEREGEAGDAWQGRRQRREGVACGSGGA